MVFKNYFIDNHSIHQHNTRQTKNANENNKKQQMINSSPPSATYMRLWTGSALVQVIASCLLGTNYQLDP